MSVPCPPLSRNPLLFLQLYVSGSTGVRSRVWLDGSAVHPESYDVVAKMAADLGVPVARLVGSSELVRRIDIKKYVDGTRGDIHRTSSAPFNAYDPSRFGVALAGTGTFTFTDANNGTFSYTIDGVTQSKPITRYVFAAPLTPCRFN